MLPSAVPLVLVLSIVTVPPVVPEEPELLSVRADLEHPVSTDTKINRNKKVHLLLGIAVKVSMINDQLQQVQFYSCSFSR